MKTKATQFMQVTEETKLVTVTRRDISPGYQMAQSTHATADIVYKLAFSKDSQLLHDWKRVSNSVINLSVKDIEELETIYNKFKDEVTIVKFFEPDIDEYTSIGFILHKDQRKKLSHLPLSLRNTIEYSKEEYLDIKEKMTNLAKSNK